MGTQPPADVLFYFLRLIFQKENTWEPQHPLRLPTCGEISSSRLISFIAHFECIFFKIHFNSIRKNNYFKKKMKNKTFGQTFRTGFGKRSAPKCTHINIYVFIYLKGRVSYRKRSSRWTGHGWGVAPAGDDYQRRPHPPSIFFGLYRLRPVRRIFFSQKKNIKNFHSISRLLEVDYDSRWDTFR